MFKIKLLGAGLVMCGVFCANAEAKLYKWVDDNGTTHYGETIPPEYANKDSSQLNDKGFVEKKTEKVTPEERRAKEEQEAKKNNEQQATIEAKRRDTALLSTFSNEKEIDLARERNSQQVLARIESIKTMLDSAQESVVEHNKEQENLLKQNKQIPQSLTEDIAESQAKVEKLKKELSQNEKELASVRAKFDADKLRFRELKSSSDKNAQKK